jgi:purine-binding chemotaxis protein CheW
LAKEPVAADVIAEMLSDPAFGSVDVEGEVEVDAATAADRIAAELIAEMEADPAFPIPTADAEALDPIALLLAEMDADPAFASVAPIAASSVAADLIAEMEADPAFAAAIEESAPVEIEEDPHEREAVAEMQMMQAERLSRRVAAPAPGTPARPMPLRRPANALPRHIQALFRPVDTDQVQSHLRPTERSSRWLRLRCGEQAYALELLKVREVVLPTPLLRLRGTARSMLGIMNLRGLVVPVLDLGLYLGVDSVDIDPNTRVVVLEENGETMGLRVSAVEDVTTLTDQQIEPPDNTRLCRFSNQFFRGVARLGQRPMILLDASQLLH